MAEGPDASIEALNALLQSDVPFVRYQAAFELLKRDQPQGLDVIIDHLEQGNADYLDRYEVVNLLANYNDERVVDVLIGMIDQMGGHIVGNVLAALLAISAERGVQAVIEMLKAPSPWWGWQTAQLFADHGDRYVPQLLEASSHSDPLMRARSIYALGRVAASHENKVIQDRLTAALNDPDATVCEKAAAGLAHLSSPTAHLALLTVLDSEDIPAAQWAAEGLYRAGQSEDEAINTLIQSLKQDHWLLRRNAVWALHRMGAVKSVPALMGVASQDPNRGIRTYAVDALAAIGDIRAVPVVRNGLADADELVRASCIKALSDLVGIEAAPEFVTLRSDPSLVVQQAITEAWQKLNYLPPDETKE